MVTRLALHEIAAQEQPYLLAEEKRPPDADICQPIDADEDFKRTFLRTDLPTML